MYSFIFISSSVLTAFDIPHARMSTTVPIIIPVYQFLVAAKKKVAHINRFPEQAALKAFRATEDITGPVPADTRRWMPSVHDRVAR